MAIGAVTTKVTMKATTMTTDDDGYVYSRGDHDVHDGDGDGERLRIR